MPNCMGLLTSTESVYSLHFASWILESIVARCEGGGLYLSKLQGPQNLDPPLILPNNLNVIITVICSSVKTDKGMYKCEKTLSAYLQNMNAVIISSDS